MHSSRREVYLDHAATTYLDPRVKAAMEPYWELDFGNPSSLYRLGRRAKAALEAARTTIAHALHCEPSEIIFTSSGTESDNLALFGLCKAWEKAHPNASKRHIITSAIEHHAVLNACRQLEDEGYSVTYLAVDADGLVDPAAVTAAIQDDTLCVSIMYANNEVGTVQPIIEIAALCREKGIYFHTDACQAAGSLSLDVKAIGVDLMTINGSKIYGPKGIGLLYVKQGVPLRPLLYGGGQEKTLRSGTENIPAIIGLAKALELATLEKSSENERLAKLRDYLVTELTSRLSDIVLNGHPVKRLPNNCNITFQGIDGEAFVLLADEVGIACATGSACDTPSMDPSHVLLALGQTPLAAQASVRFTLGKRTSKADIDYALREIVSIVERLRQAA